MPPPDGLDASDQFRRKLVRRQVGNLIDRVARRALSSRSSGARIEQGVGEVEEAQCLRLQQLRDLGSVVAAANKARIARLAAFDDTFQPFECAVRPKKVSKAQCLVAPPL